MTLITLCDSQLRHQIQSNLDRFEVIADRDPDHRRAAVAVLVVEEGMGADLPGVEQPSEWSTIFHVGST